MFHFNEVFPADAACLISRNMISVRREESNATAQRFVLHQCCLMLIFVVMQATVAVGSVTGVGGIVAGDVPALARAGYVREVASTFGSGGGHGRLLFVESTGRLYATPNDASFVLVVDAVTHVVDNTTLGGLGNQPRKWAGMARAGNKLCK